MTKIIGIKLKFKLNNKLSLNLTNKISKSKNLLLVDWTSKITKGVIHKNLNLSSFWSIFKIINLTS